MFNPHVHYLILTQRFVSMIGEAVPRLSGHDAVRDAVVPTLSGSAGGWRRTKCDLGDGYIVPVEIRGVPLALRVIFAADDTGKRTTAPDGRKAIVYATHAYPPK